MWGCPLTAQLTFNKIQAKQQCCQGDKNKKAAGVTTLSIPWEWGLAAARLGSHSSPMVAWEGGEYPVLGKAPRAREDKT